MTFYQELQLNQAGSKAVIRNCTDKKEKLRHIAIYLFKIFITMVFCMAVVIGFSKIFGNGNSIVGVVVLLCVMAFRFADFGIRTPHAMGALVIMFAILTFGPRLANAGGLAQEFLVNTVCILILMVLGCHNVVMFNHSTLLLSYLLLYGYDVTGELYIQRLIAMGIGAAATLIVYYRNHHKKVYKRSLKDVFQEFDMHSLRTRWQITMVFGRDNGYADCRITAYSASDVDRNRGDVYSGAVSRRCEAACQSQSSGQYCWMLRISGTVLFLAAVCLQLCGCHWRDWCRSFGNLWMSGNFQYLWGVIYCCWNPWIARGDILPNF